MKRNIRMISTRLLGERVTSGLIRRYHDWLGFSPSDVGTSHSNEVDVLDHLLSHVEVSQTFGEFGVDLAEFNCGRLALRSKPPFTSAAKTA